MYGAQRLLRSDRKDDEMQIDEILQRIETAMGKFAEAIQVYAQHLASHTSAVINLAEAA
jgi:hypothetical protein